MRAMSLEPDPFSPEQAAVLLRAAHAAPSIHNSQPWRFAFGADRVEVFVDQSRSLPAIDPDGRQRLISCGAAVLNLRVAMSHLGSEPLTMLWPHRSTGHHVASVARGPLRSAGVEERRLYSVMWRRRTNRGPYWTSPVPAPVMRRLLAAAEREGCVLHAVVSHSARVAAAALIARGIDEQAASPAVAREFGHWLSNEPRPVVGTPFESWLRAPYPLPLLSGRDHLTTAERTELTELVAASTVLVLCSTADGTVDRLLAGQALERVLLTAAGAGVAVSFLNQPVEVPALRDELAALVGDRIPQMVLRVGYARHGAIPTDRRPLHLVTQ